MTNEERAEEPCIGRERADLVVCGCAILEALAREWPASRIRVADRGLREGVLAELAQKARRQRRLGRAKKRAFSPLNGPEHG
jgi:exopolyphosphatase/guanosine-5'-triphosphate,3'-diphosphate pyrophosphatase